MDNIKGLFQLPIIETNIGNWGDCKAEIFDQIGQSPEQIGLPDFFLATNNFISKSILEHCPLTKSVIEEHLKGYAKIIAVPSLTIIDSWVSVYKHREYIAPHRHIPKHVSGVIFLNDGFKGGEFYFENPVVDLDSMRLQEKYIEFNKYNEPVHIITPIESKLIIFNSLMMHGTTPLLSDSVRYTLAFNAEVIE